MTQREQKQDKSYRVIQHRFGWKEREGEDTKYRFGKGTLRPCRLDKIEYTDPNNEPKIDLIIPLSSIKGTDKDRPDGPSKPQIEPGLYKQKIWLGEKSQSEKGKTATSQLLPSFPHGLKDFIEELEAQAQKLSDSLSDPRKVAQLFCEKYEKRKAFAEEQKNTLENIEQVADSSGELSTWEQEESEIEILRTYGTFEQKSEYIDRVTSHYQDLFQQENSQNNPKLIREESKPYMQEFLALVNAPRTPEVIEQAMEKNCVLYGLKPGMSANNAKLVEFKPELTKGQTRLMFSQAYKFAEAYRESIPESERLSAAAAAWNEGAARQDELEKKKKSPQQEQQDQEIQKKTPNFVFAAFPGEIISRLGQLQFTDLRVGTLSNEANNFKEKQWNQEEKCSVEIRASDHPLGHDRYGARLVFVQDTDGQYKEFAALEPRTAHLPIGTKAQANILPGETSTAKATVSVPGREPVEFTIREIKKFAHADKTFHGEPVTLSIGKVPVPTGVVKIKLDGKVLGELDADSIKQLQAVNYIKDGNPLNLKLTTISEKHNAFVIAESPNGNYLKIDKTNSYDYEGQKFNDQEYRRFTLEVPQSKIRDAVFLNGQLLGVLFLNKDKEALKEIGVLNSGKLTPVEVKIQSNFNTTMIVKVDPATVDYPETWTKEGQVFGKQTVNTEQQSAIEKTAAILHKIKERPTILFATPEDKMLGLTQLVVDNHKLEAVTKWLTDKNIALTQLPREDVPLETKKGLAVFNLANSSIPEATFEAMTKKFGQVMESQEQYQEKLRSLPDRPKHLKPPQPVVSTSKVSAVANTVALPQTLQPQTSTNEQKTAPSQETQPITIEDLRSWWRTASILGKSEPYKQRIAEIGNEFKVTGQISAKALEAMRQDTVARIAHIAHKIVSALGQPGDDGTNRVNGKMYDVSFHPQRQDWAIAHKNGDIILDVQSGKVQINRLTPEILQDFEAANSKLDEVLETKRQAAGLQR